MEFLKLFLSCCVLWRTSDAAKTAGNSDTIPAAAAGGSDPFSAAAAGGSDPFSAAAARLLRDIRMPSARAALVPSVLVDLQTILQPRFPGSEAVLFGSIAMGLAVVESDVDVCVTFREQPPPSAAELVEQVHIIMLQHQDLFRVIKAIPRARNPIVTARHLPTGFNIDVSFNYNGVLNSKLVHHLMSLDDRARDLVQILKHWARIHHLTGSTMLPSYGLVTMAIFYLQQKEMLPPVASLQKNAEKIIVNDWNVAFSEDNYKTRNNESLCAMLGGFFEYYNEFEYEKRIASPFVGRALDMELFSSLATVPGEFEQYRTNVQLNISRPLPLKAPLVQDSFEHNKNLAHRIVDVEHRAVFEAAVEHAAKKFRRGCAGFLESMLETYHTNNAVNSE